MRDNGIGMSREEAISHLGTIAKSGTAEFFKRLTGDQQKDAQLIGQFGVGFYSAFIVADRVEVLTRRADAAPDAGGALGVERRRPVHGRDHHARRARHQRRAASEGGRQGIRRSVAAARAGAPLLRSHRLPGAHAARRALPRSTTRTSTRRRRCGRGRAAEIKDEEYRDLYRHIAHDGADPLAWSHNRVEGKREYTSLLYLPARAPFDLWQREAARGLKLYVRRVFIMDDAEQFLPLYLRFIKGIVDSNDLPLNVSRELLQQDREVEAMRAALTRRALELLARLAKDEPEKYAQFWREFGRVLKEGLSEDPGNRERLLPLLRFASTASAANEETREPGRLHRPHAAGAGAHLLHRRR